ncbi:MAG: carbon-nitrogen hydrolase family protein [Synergistaceae bacterium]|jgi:predicted amidohydrolase|nr:carbon-nitrogen hydrolase family protein [Synergistaceae bacterium]
MKVASIQLAISDDRTKIETVDHALKMMDCCAGSDLIVLPELWNIGFFAIDKFISESEPIDGYTAAAVGSKARELGAWVYSGSFVESRGGKYYNTSILFDRKGERAAVYNKIHLFTYKSREAEILTPGRDLAVADTEFGKVGLSTCYDLRFPEMYRKMMEQGAEFFLVTSGWPYPRHEAWEIFNRARAHENFCYLISCNSSGKQRGFLALGHSKIVDPWGTVVADSDYRETIVRADIDPGLVRTARAEFPVLNDRVFK